MFKNYSTTRSAKVKELLVSSPFVVVTFDLGLKGKRPLETRALEIIKDVSKRKGLKGGSFPDVSKLDLIGYSSPVRHAVMLLFQEKEWSPKNGLIIELSTGQKLKLKSAHKSANEPDCIFRDCILVDYSSLNEPIVDSKGVLKLNKEAFWELYLYAVCFIGSYGKKFDIKYLSELVLLDGFVTKSKLPFSKYLQRD